MRFAFRTDASLEIGSGHVMRCLSIADALKSQHAESLFICRAHQGHMAETILSRGHKLELLEAQPNTKADQKKPQLAHSSWLNTGWQQDAEESLQILKKHAFDWLIIDHYALDIHWEQLVRNGSTQIMVIDDLVDRQHHCDLLLDQTYGRQNSDYINLVPDGCQLLTGADNALLRPEFHQLRQHSLLRRKQPAIKHLLITMGGVDQDNITGKILDILKQCHLPDNIHISVIMGESAPWISDIRKQAIVFPGNVTVMSNVSNMAQIMSASDLCIGAAGSTAWERCCLGLPTLMVVLADNQKDIAMALENLGACMNLGEPNIPHFSEQAIANINTLLDDADARNKMSAAAATVTNGEGIKNTLHYLLGKK